MERYIAMTGFTQRAQRRAQSPQGKLKILTDNNLKETTFRSRIHKNLHEFCDQLRPLREKILKLYLGLT
jgi:hypothetical protein